MLLNPVSKPPPPPKKIECCLYIYLQVLSILEPGKFYFLKLENLILKE